MLEFGSETSMLAYLLVAGIITRRIHEFYVKQTEKYHASQNPNDHPRHLVITIEKAHKFLNPRTRQTNNFRNDCQRDAQIFRLAVDC